MAAIKDGKLKLSAAERRAFFASDWPTLAGSGKPPAYLKGVRYVLSSRLWFTVKDVHRTRKGWWLELHVVDDRERRFHLLPAARTIETHRKTAPREMTPEEELGYTRNPKRKNADPLPSVPPNVQNVLDMRAKLERVTHDREHDPEREAERDLQRLQGEVRELVQRAVRMGVDPIVAIAPLARALEQAHLELEKVA